MGTGGGDSKAGTQLQQGRKVKTAGQELSIRRAGTQHPQGRNTASAGQEGEDSRAGKVKTAVLEGEDSISSPQPVGVTFSTLKSSHLCG